MAEKMRTMRDTTGADVPVKYVSKYDRECDARTRRIAGRFMKARKYLEQVVANTLQDLAALQSARATEVAPRGNFQCQSFDGLIRVSIDQAWHIRLDDRVVAARDMMLAYARGLCAKAGNDAQALYEIVEEAFAAGRTGGLSVGRVLSLCRREISAEEWQTARRMLLESIQTDRGKAYIRVATRADLQHDFRMIRLDLADCWPDTESEAAPCC